MREPSATHELEAGLQSIRNAALDKNKVAGLTHQFYKYPARFSPSFARAAIKAFSRPGDVVLDPYMGGGTTPLEAMALGRKAVGSDINSLAVFVAKVKLTRLSRLERVYISMWVDIVPSLKCTDWLDPCDAELTHKPRNLTLPSVKWHRKFIAICLNSIEQNLPTDNSKRFARCVVLNVGHWALNGKRRLPTIDEFRNRVVKTCYDMLQGLDELDRRMTLCDAKTLRPVLRQNAAETIDKDSTIRRAGDADLVVTSPPYPGIHMLYHRWQVDGRKETDAPYWIAGCNDGDGATHYNFAGRQATGVDRYFEKACETFSSVRSIMKDGAFLVQMIAFSDPKKQLPRYLKTMCQSGYKEVRLESNQRTWRQVPGRRWHANLKGNTSSSREVVLVHEAV